MTVFRTTEEYLEEIAAAVQARGKLTDWSEVSVVRALAEGFASGLSLHSLTAQQIVEDSSLRTATGDALDLKAADWLVERKPASIATGTVRIQRDAPGDEITIPAGSVQLQTRKVGGQPPVVVVTTDDARLEANDTQVDVPAETITTGQAANLAAGTILLPVNPILGLQTDGGFVVQAEFTGGVDAETDEQFRARIPIDVQGRVPGREASFLRAALGIVGVFSANVLGPGDDRGDGTSPAPGNIEVYYEGDASLLAQVQDACNGAATMGQTVLAQRATCVACVAGVEVFVAPGADETEVEADVKEAIIGVFDAAGVGETVRQSSIVRAIDEVEVVRALDMPFAELRRDDDVEGTVGDILPDPVELLTIDEAAITVTVTELS